MGAASAVLMTTHAHVTENVYAVAAAPKARNQAPHTHGLWKKALRLIGIRREKKPPKPSKNARATPIVASAKSQPAVIAEAPARPVASALPSAVARPPSRIEASESFSVLELSEEDEASEAAEADNEAMTSGE